MLITALFLCLACAGCVSSRTIARRALEAPNKQFKPPRAFRQFASVATNFPVQRISVGPPPATLELMVIEPGDYGAKTISSFSNGHFKFGLDFSKYPPQPRLETNDVRGTIFLLHGYSSDKNFMLGWGMALAQAGYRTVLVDLRGHGHSTGDRIYFGGIERTDLVQCLDSLIQRRICRGAGWRTGHFIRSRGGLAMGGGGPAREQRDGNLTLFRPGHGGGGISQGKGSLIARANRPEGGGNYHE